jgi:predicted nuclease of predicted toxin-antitoxin system
MRLRLVENLPSELARLFIEAGHDAVTVLDQDIGGATDAIVVSACLSEGRAIVTMDTHFADIRGYPSHLYPGIVVFRLDSQTRDHVLAVGARLLPTLSEEVLQGRLWIVEESRVRVRS